MAGLAKLQNRSIMIVYISAEPAKGTTLSPHASETDTMPLKEIIFLIFACKMHQFLIKPFFLINEILIVVQSLLQKTSRQTCHE